MSRNLNYVYGPFVLRMMSLVGWMRGKLGVALGDVFAVGRVEAVMMIVFELRRRGCRFSF